MQKTQPPLTPDAEDPTSSHSGCRRPNLLSLLMQKTFTTAPQGCENFTTASSPHLSAKPCRRPCRRPSSQHPHLYSLQKAFTTAPSIPYTEDLSSTLLSPYTEDLLYSTLLSLPIIMEDLHHSTVSHSSAELELSSPSPQSFIPAEKNSVIPVFMLLSFQVSLHEKCTVKVVTNYPCDNLVATWKQCVCVGGGGGGGGQVASQTMVIRQSYLMTEFFQCRCVNSTPAHSSAASTGEGEVCAVKLLTWYICSVNIIMQTITCPPYRES